MRSRVINLGAVMALALLGAAACDARTRATADSAPADYVRADPGAIRAHLQDILSDPQYMPHKTFGRWLAEKLSRWEGPRLPRGLKKFISRAVLFWCLLTLLAIFGHLVWTIWLLVRPQRGSPAAALPGSEENYENASPEELWERSAALARAGAFRAASGVLLVALLRRLDALQVLHFHKSKTNGEYLREYASQRGGRRQFVQFLTAFERSVYGGIDMARPTYDTMTTLAQQVLNDASEEPPV